MSRIKFINHIGRKINTKANKKINDVNDAFFIHFFHMLTDYSVARRYFAQAGERLAPLHTITKIIYSVDNIRDKEGAFDKKSAMEAVGNWSNVVTLKRTWRMKSGNLMLMYNFEVDPSESLKYISMGSSSWYRSTNKAKIKAWLGALSREIRDEREGYSIAIRRYIANFEQEIQNQDPRPYFRVAVKTFIRKKGFLNNVI